MGEDGFGLPDSMAGMGTILPSEGNVESMENPRHRRCRCREAQGRTGARRPRPHQKQTTRLDLAKRKHIWKDRLS